MNEHPQLDVDEEHPLYPAEFTPVPPEAQKVSVIRELWHGWRARGH